MERRNCPFIIITSLTVLFAFSQVTAELIDSFVNWMDAKNKEFNQLIKSPDKIMASIQVINEKVDNIEIKK